MPPQETRYDYRDETPGDELRLVAVVKKTRAGAAQLEKELCANGGTTSERLHKLLASHTIAEVDAAIKRWGSDFERHLGEIIVGKPEDSRIPGWLKKWEEAKEEREERIEEVIHGGV